MKKLVLLFAMILAAVGINAQTLGDGNLYFGYTGATTDTVSQTRTWNKVIVPNATYTLYYDAVVKLTEVAATTQTAAAWQGKKFDTDSWTTITTINYKGTGSDTTFYYSQESTKQFYTQYRLLVTPTNGKIKITYLKAYFRK